MFIIVIRIDQLAKDLRLVIDVRLVSLIEECDLAVDLLAELTLSN